MSGGHIHSTNHILMIIEDIEEAMNNPEHGFTPETQKLIATGMGVLAAADVYAHRIDCLLSGDDSEDSFNKRVAIDLRDLRSIMKRLEQT